MPADEKCWDRKTRKCFTSTFERIRGGGEASEFRWLSYMTLYGCGKTPFRLVEARVWDEGLGHSVFQSQNSGEQSSLSVPKGCPQRRRIFIWKQKQADEKILPLLPLTVEQLSPSRSHLNSMPISTLPSVWSSEVKVQGEYTQFIVEDCKPLF